MSEPATPVALTDEQRTVLLALLRGTLTVAAAASASGLTPRQLVRWRRDYLRAKVPPHTGTLAAPVRQPVTIHWDRWGLPHIRASAMADLWVALGYCMAQERLWQLDYMRRLARGELAAILGPAALASDRALRTLDLSGAAAASLPQLDEAEAEALGGLSAGINAWLEQSHPLPLEFELLDYQPTPWAPVDSILLWKYRWWTLTGRLEGIALTELVTRHLPPSLAAAFLATELADETIIPAGSAAEGPAATPLTGHDSGEGSNNWVLAGARSTTGQPVLCSDPHNPFANPPQWFEAQLSAPGLDAIGAIYLGTPGVYLGRNRRVAWGVTNHAVSVRDLYREELNPADPNQYRDGATWRPLLREEEVIAVAGGPADRLVRRRTVRGPIVNELLPAIDPAGEPPLSLRWVGYEPPSGVRAMLDLQRADSVAAFRRALGHWPCPPLNFVAADVAGAIGYQVAGRVPMRPRIQRGLRLADDPTAVWTGSLPLRDLPQQEAPPHGWLATANNVPWSVRPDTAAADYLRLGTWADGYRMRRIRVRLEAETPLTPAAVGAIQADIVHQRALDLAPALVVGLRASAEPALLAVADRLSRWDGQLSRTSVAATLFQTIWECFKARVVAARLPGLAATMPTVLNQVGSLARRLIEGDDPGWWPATTTAVELQQATHEALATLTARLGPDQARWQWGRLHRVIFPHPLGHRPGLQRLNVGPFATSGGVGTVRAAGFEPGTNFRVTSGSTYRLVCDLSASHAWGTVTTGLSGHLASRHYRDQVGAWLHDQYKPLLMEEAEVLANLDGILQLRP